ncbi:MAG: response regulator transcription factor [Bacteroidota bacterium]|nr:response regulator transcription factor [Bacteroidota bacterium]
MSIKIIIADDHRVFIDGMKALLKEIAGIEVVADAENGILLIEQVAKYKPDIVLTDIQMPLKNGIEATLEIHALFPEVKVIALTMLNESIYIKKMLEAGASGYVLKTTGKEELIQVIKKVAAGEKYFSSEVSNLLMNNFSVKSQTGTLEILTKREKEILILIAEGYTDKEIADKVFLSSLTIITHRKNILSKLGLKNKVELTRFAMEHNLLG